MFGKTSQQGYQTSRNLSWTRKTNMKKRKKWEAKKEKDKNMEKKNGKHEQLSRVITCYHSLSQVMTSYDMLGDRVVKFSRT